MMSGLKKQINYLLLFSVLLGTFFPTIVFAEESEQDEKGKMEIRIDRITKYREQVNEIFQETELQKRMPMLFDVSTYDRITEIQQNNASVRDELKHRVLVEDIEEDAFVADVQNVLFTDDYEVASSASEDNERSKSELLSTGVVAASFILLGLLLCVGIYFFVQKWSSS